MKEQAIHSFNIWKNVGKPIPEICSRLSAFHRQTASPFFEGDSQEHFFSDEYCYTYFAFPFFK